VKAVVVGVAGAPEVLEFRDLPRPVPKAGWVLVRVKAFGLNRGELLTRQGHSPSVTFPRVLGIECVGVVEEAPGGEFARGTKVACVVGGMGRAFDGSYAEFVSVPATSVYAIDTDLDWVRFAAIPESFVTAYGALHDALEIRTGQTLLVRGATSSVGLTATSLAKGWGLRVLATTRPAARRQALLDNGADDVVIDNGSIAATVRERVPGGVDRVFELVGTATLRDSLRCAAPRGIVCMSGILGNAWTLDGFSPGEEIPTTVRLTYYSSNSAVEGNTRGARLQDFVDGVASGRYRSAIDRVFPLDEIVAAHRWMEENRAIGKIVITVDASDTR
jgi:NADPH:quinone reductase-like Zn-dependent oxidoreductase